MKQVIQARLQPIDARIEIPGSKSITNRAFLLAALANGETHLSHVLCSDDTLAFLKALEALGVVCHFNSQDRSCVIQGVSGQFPRLNAEIHCERAGTVARFLIAALAGTPGVYHCEADSQLQKRPMEKLMRVLLQQGASIVEGHPNHLPFVLQGTDQLSGGEIEIESDESSQFVSALLMIAPYAKQDVLLKVRGGLRLAYVEMTIRMMQDFGVIVEKRNAKEFFIRKGQAYQSRYYAIEADLSTASYFLAAAALTSGKLRMQKVDRKQALQADLAFLSILEKMGAEILEGPDFLEIRGPKILQGIDVDMRDCSDTFMTLAALAPFANTATMIRNIGHTRLQESNRVSAMTEGLRRLGVRVEESEENLKIFPSYVKAAEIDSHQDHRIAMSFALIGLRVPGVSIQGAECVSKTCPDFFGMLERL